jgi:hypothetical protein
LAARTWLPPTPKQVLALVALSSRRLVRSSAELLNLVEDVLADVAQDMAGHYELLWDRLPKKDTGGTADRWMPKPEAALCAYIAHELQIRMHGRGLAVNREVMIRPTNDFGAGDRTDILVESMLTSREATFEPKRIALVVEVKGLWNRDLLTAQADQLALRYLPQASTDVGIYLVGWFSVSGWTVATDHRLAVAAKLDQAETLRRLVAQADEIRRETNVAVKPTVMSIDRPRPTSMAD